MRTVYHPETETVEVPVEFIERLDRRAARIEVLLVILKLLIDEMRAEEQGRRFRLLGPTTLPLSPFVG